MQWHHSSLMNLHRSSLFWVFIYGHGYRLRCITIPRSTTFYVSKRYPFWSASLHCQYLTWCIKANCHSCKIKTNATCELIRLLLELIYIWCTIDFWTKFGVIYNLKCALQLKHGQGVVFEHYYIKWEENIH